MADTIKLSLNAPTSRPGPDMNAFLSLGFRPLYIAGCGWALVAIALWVFAPHWLSGPLAGVAWHAHEMLWGFIATIAVGFLLTASATWTGHNPMQGKALGALTLVWLLARVGYLVPSQPVFFAALALDTLFFLGAAHSLMRVVLKSPNRRNDGIPFLVAGLGLSNLLFLLAAYEGNYAGLMHQFNLGLVCMAVIALLIGRRVIPFFAMRMVPGLAIPMQTRSGQVQLVISVVAIVLGLFGQNLAMGVALGAVGAIGLVQLLRWRPLAVLHKPMLWVLYLGYGQMGLGLVAAALHFAGVQGLFARPATPIHLIGMGGFAVLIIGMVTRTALGHLGRPLKLDGSMLLSYYLVIAAVLLRLAALYPSAYMAVLLQASAICWVAAMGLYLWRFVPMLVRPRPDSL